MTDQFLYQCVHKYLINLLENPLETPIYDYPNLLIKLFIQTKQMFHNVELTILKYFRQQLLLLDYQSNRNPANSFTKLLLFNDQPVLDYCQILIRLIILGLCLKQGLQPKQYLWNYKLSKLINDCQLNLVFDSCNQTLSSLLKVHLELLSPFMNILDFYEKLRKLFAYKQLFMLVEWADMKMKDLKKKSNQILVPEQHGRKIQKKKMKLKCVKQQTQNQPTQAITTSQCQNKKQTKKKDLSAPKQQKSNVNIIFKNQGRRKSLSRTLYFERKHPHSVAYKTVIEYESVQQKQQQKNELENGTQQQKYRKSYLQSRKTTF